jgi:hypothetical protein
MPDFTRVGYGQVEPNQLSAQKTGQIYARLPLDPEVTVLQNGEFMFYDYANGTVNSGKAAGTGVHETKGEPMLVFNEIKLYEPFWRRSYKDFAMIRVGDNYVTSDLAVNGPVEGRYDDGALTVGVNANPAHPDYGYRMDGIAPRLFKTNIGDIYTTNMVKTGSGIDYAVGDILVPVKNATTKTLQLEIEDNSQGSTQVAAGTKWMVVQKYTMPDGQPGLKLQRVE